MSRLKLLVIFKALTIPLILLSVQVSAQEQIPDSIAIANCSAWDTCSQGCEQKINSFICTCIEGFSLAENNRTCNPNDPNIQIVYAMKNSIRVWSKKDRKQKIISPGSHTVGVAVDVANKYVFWTDIRRSGDETIFRSKINGSDPIVLVSNGLGVAEGLVFDWITGNIYFADSNKSHIVVCNGEGTFCSVLIKGYSTKLREIALHPAKGLMFMTDWGDKPAIVQAGMDGSFPLPIIMEGLVWPNGLAVDHGKGRLYWMDAKLKTIESATLTGGDRRIIKSNGIEHPFNLDIFGDTLYWTDWKSNSIQSCNKFNGSEHDELIISETAGGFPHGLTIYHPAAQDKFRLNPCDSARCSHICVLTSKNGTSCFCPAGMVLDKNRRNCIDDENKPKFAIAHDNRIRTFRLNTIGRDVLEETTLSGLNSIGAMAYNPVNKTLMLSDTILRKIYEFNPWTKKVRVVADRRIETVRGLAYDIVGENLYWVDSSLRRVEVISMQTGARAIISHEKQFPQDIVVIPEKKFMFIALHSAGSAGRIVRMNMNGYKRQVVMRIPGGEPTSLTYHMKMDRLFWCDIKKNTIGHMSLNGRSSAVALSSEGNPYSIMSFGNRVYWSDRHTQYMYSMPVVGMFEKEQPLFIGHTEDGQNETLSSYITGNFLARIAVVDNDISRYDTLLEDHDCSSYRPTPKCSHICLISEDDNVGTCLCPEGMQLTKYGKTCTTNLTCSENEFQCNDNRCIDKDVLCDGFGDCATSEDELNCEIIHSCRESDFVCESDGACIPSTSRCNLVDECEDGSDEKDCGEPPCTENCDIPQLPSSTKSPSSSTRSTTRTPSKKKSKDKKPKSQESNKTNESTPVPPTQYVPTNDYDENHNPLWDSTEHEHDLAVKTEEEPTSTVAIAALVITITLLIVAVVLLLVYILQKKRISPKNVMRPYVQQLVKYVNRPAKRWSQSKRGQQKLTDDNTYDDAYDCSTGNYGRGTYANPTYEEIDGCATMKMMRQNSGGKEDGARSSSDSGILTVMDTDPQHLYEELDSHYNSYTQKDTLLDKELC